MKIRNSFSTTATTLALALTLSSAGADEAIDTLKKEVVANYAAIAGHSFADAQKQAVALKEALTAFTSAPSKETQDKAKQAWIAARLPYLQSEVFRVSDADAGALDEAPSGSLIKADEKAGGFHVIEFLLWGDDHSVDGPGERPYEDYIVGKQADAPRRAAYLNACADLVVDRLSALAADWQRDVADNARAKLVAQPVDDSLGQILDNIVSLAGTGLAKNRIGAAYESRKQADESSNFSDTTHLDLAYSCAGIANLVAGAYAGIDKQVKVQGSGLLKLVTALDAEKGEALKLSTNRVMLAVTSFRPPFDRALLAPDDSPARGAIKEMIDALGEFATRVQALSEIPALGGER